MSTFPHRVFSDMDLDRKFEIATSCRSFTLVSLVLDLQYPIVHAEHKHALLPERPVGDLRFANLLYRDNMATSCRRKTSKSSIPKRDPISDL